jgi:hypothetical protein
MRVFTMTMAAAAAALLLMGGTASAQQKAAPSKAQGAGAECSRMTDAKARDECVRQAQQKGAGATAKGKDADKGKGADKATGSGKNDDKVKGKKG